MLIFKFHLHELFVVETRNYLELDRYEEESNSLEHHRCQTGIRRIDNLSVFTEVECGGCNIPNPFKANSSAPIWLRFKDCERHLVDQLQEDVNQQVRQHEVLECDLKTIQALLFLQELDVVKHQDHDEENVAKRKDRLVEN